MIALHVFRWGLDLTRLTQDVDLGVMPRVVQTPELTDGLERLGYSKTAGNRFEKPVTGLPSTAADRNATIDVLIPAHQSRPRHNRKFGQHLVTTEVPGLAAAFQRQPVDLQLEVTFLDGSDRWLDGWPSPPDRSARIAALVGGCRLGAGRADELAVMVAEVIAGCTRAVVRKIAAGIPAFVQMEREGILATLDSQHRAATQLRPLVAHAVARRLAIG